MTAAMIEMRNISIDFPGVAALKNVHFQIEKGKIQALIGANGAGKSTLMKVLSGAYDHYRGDIYFNQDKEDIRTPKKAKELGIQMVYQEVDTALVGNLTVGENIMLEQMVHQMGRKQWINWKTVHKEAANILADLKVDIPTNRLVQELTLAEKQMVVIARAISNQCQCLILDEPTAPLSQNETDELFRLIRLLKEKGVAIIFISHRLPELFKICEAITVMRNGEIVMTEKTEFTSPKSVVEHMLGKSLGEQYPLRKPEIGRTVLETKAFSDGDMVKNLTIHMRKGEIVGLAGLVGAGKTEICKALFGAAPKYSGEIIIRGKREKFQSPADAVHAGVALVPEERRKEGLVVSESVAANLSVSVLQRLSKIFGLIQFQDEKREANDLINRLNIKTPSPDTKAESLSGGNQQKVVIGKWLAGDSEIYILDEPTKGVDVGAKREIFQLIADLAAQGKSVLYASSELSDILGMTDRVYVIYDGKVVKELETALTNEQELLYYSTGGK
jgi:simple sugar transport system ATP-binding protein